MTLFVLLLQTSQLCLNENIERKKLHCFCANPEAQMKGSPESPGQTASNACIGEGNIWRKRIYKMFEKEY